MAYALSVVSMYCTSGHTIESMISGHTINPVDSMATVCENSQWQVFEVEITMKESNLLCGDLNARMLLTTFLRYDSEIIQVTFTCINYFVDTRRSLEY